MGLLSFLLSDIVLVAVILKPKSVSTWQSPGECYELRKLAPHPLHPGLLDLDQFGTQVFGILLQSLFVVCLEKNT